MHTVSFWSVEDVSQPPPVTPVLPEGSFRVLMAPGREDLQGEAASPRWPFRDGGLPRAFGATPFGGALVSVSERVLASARRLASSPAVARSYGRDGVPRSLDGTICWDDDQPRCVLFAGDAIFAAGFVAPTELRPDRVGGTGGVRSYVPAARWAEAAGLMFPVSDPASIRAGDLLVVAAADQERGHPGAHIEIITVWEHDGHVLEISSLGARGSGLCEDNKHGDKLRAARADGSGFVHRDARGRCFALQVLRPRCHQGESPCDNQMIEGI